MYFLVAWFHAVVQERLRYVPLGWSKTYDFNNSDLEAAFRTIDAWLVTAAKGRANIDPATIPWTAIRTLLKQSVYGGRVDSDFDQQILDAFIDGLFTPAAYNVDFDLVPRTQDEKVLQPPDGIKMNHFLDWVHKLPDIEPPSWLSLPPNAEKLIAVTEGEALLGKLRKMKTLADDDDEAVTISGPSGSSEAQPAWMRTLLQHCEGWLSSLPERLPPSTQRADETDPLKRLFSRETRVGSGLLRQVRRDLADVILVCKGELKQTNHLRSLLSHLTKGTIPPTWMRFKVPRVMSASQWVTNFSQRLGQLHEVGNLNDFTGVQVWLGGLFFPEAYVTVTRQAVAHRNRWSLETLALSLDLEESGSGGFVVEGLVLEGANWQDETLRLNDGDAVRLKPSRVRWTKIDPSSTVAAKANVVTLPVYLNGDRSDVLFTVDLPFEGCEKGLIAQRAICLTASG